MGLNTRPHTYAAGDVVRTIAGKIDWQLVWSPSPGRWWLRSGMSGRHVLKYEHQIRPWVPHER